MSTRPSSANLARPAFCLVLSTRLCAFLVVGSSLAISICKIMLCANWALAGDEPIASATVNDPLKIPPLTGATKTESGRATTVKWSADALRAKYPFASLDERLAYERKRTSSIKQHVIAATPLTEAAKQSLDAQESSFELQRRYDLRTRALGALHSDRVAQFISQQGFGESRMVMPTPSHLELPEAPPVQFATVSSDAYEQEGVRALTIPATTAERGEAPERLPSLAMLREFHGNSRWNFLTVAAWGVVKGNKQAAGFEGHAFRDLPTLVEPRASSDDPRPPEPDPKHPWQLTRLELISLLTHDKPQVYVSNRLPRMAELARAKVRELSDFEQQGLTTLQKGGELAADATLNRIYMLGAVRASKQCLECHDAQRGELLGAFSYELRRDPPVKPVRKPAA